jgi:[ribosomal protein S5]-alanine N-acetyltransferase
MNDMTCSLDTLATPRLIARAIAPADFSNIYSDLKVMKTLSADGKPLSEEKAREHIQQAVEHWQTHGFGFWVFRRRSDGQLIGRGGLAQNTTPSGEIRIDDVESLFLLNGPILPS